MMGRKWKKWLDTWRRRWNFQQTVLKNECRNLIILHQLVKGISNMKLVLERLTQAVADCKSTVDSAITLIQGLVEKLQEAQGDPAAMHSLITELDAITQTLADAVAANTETPAEEPPAEEPETPVDFGGNVIS
jgi:uncharacterized coiled-coil protein SlyX